MDVSWGALAVALTVVGTALSWVAWRRRGLAAGLRGLAWSLLPVAAWLTGLLPLVGDFIGEIGAWSLRLVFSPVVWTGIGVAGLSALLFVVSGFLRRRSGGRQPRGLETRAPRPAGAERAPRPAVPARTNDDVEGMDEIEAILKKHGI